MTGPAPIITGRTLSEQQSRDLGALFTLRSLKPLASHLYDNPELWGPVLDENEAEAFLPPSTDWAEEGISAERRMFLSLAVVHALRPDRTMAAGAEFVETVFAEDGGEMKDRDEGQDEEHSQASGLPWNEPLDLEEAVKEGARPEAPVLLCSEAGHDASWKVTCLVLFIE